MLPVHKKSKPLKWSKAFQRDWSKVTWQHSKRKTRRTIRKHRWTSKAPTFQLAYKSRLLRFDFDSKIRWRGKFYKLSPVLWALRSTVKLCLEFQARKSKIHLSCCMLQIEWSLQSKCFSGASLWTTEPTATTWTWRNFLFFLHHRQIRNLWWFLSPWNAVQADQCSCDELSARFSKFPVHHLVIMWTLVIREPRKTKQLHKLSSAIRKSK